MYIYIYAAHIIYRWYKRVTTHLTIWPEGSFKIGFLVASFVMTSNRVPFGLGGEFGDESTKPSMMLFVACC